MDNSISAIVQDLKYVWTAIIIITGFFHVQVQKKMKDALPTVCHKLGFWFGWIQNLVIIGGVTILIRYLVKGS